MVFSAKQSLLGSFDLRSGTEQYQRVIGLEFYIWRRILPGHGASPQRLNPDSDLLQIEIAQPVVDRMGRLRQCHRMNHFERVTGVIGNAATPYWVPT